MNKMKHSNRIRKISKVLLLSSLALIALPAGAVSYAGSSWASRANTAGSTFKVMKSSDDHFCYLNAVKVEETDTPNESAFCTVRLDNRVWVLEAVLGMNNDAKVSCGAVCYKH